jgi:hypothetical protein
MKQVWIFLLLIACQQATTSEDLRQAGEIHLQSLAVADDLEAALDSLEQSGALPLDTLAALKRDLEAWEENLVEVPGLEHEHAHEGHDHHHHEAAPSISDAEMLQVQQEALRQLRALETRVQSFKK